MKFKVKNSELCLCGSGKKFNSCCKGKILNCKSTIKEEILKNPQRINHMIQQKFKNTDFKVCLHPKKDECKKPIKNAHTLQNNGVLSIIAENDHVMVTDTFNKIREGSILKKVSKNQATTFYGFCEYHDSVVFSEIETAEYIGSQKQNFLFAYRACAQEYHKKIRSIKSIQQTFRDNPSILLAPYFYENYKSVELSYNDVKETIDIFNDAFMRDDFNILENYVYKFDKVYDFAVTTMFAPTYDLKGKQLTDIYSTDEERLKSIFVSFIPTKDNSYMIISCIKEDYEHFKGYINQIKSLDEEKLKIFLNNLLPTYSENIVLSPRLWTKWTPFSQKKYEEVLEGGTGEFDKLLSGESPFDSYEDFIKSMAIKNGICNMLEAPKYNLFKL